MLQTLSDIFFPRFCFACNQHIDTGLLCSHCLARLKIITPGNRCLHCQKPTATGGMKVCKSCRNKNVVYDYLISCFLYQEPLRSLLFLYKYGHYDFFSHLFASLMIKHLDRIGFAHHNYDMIVPVPLYPSKKRQRQYNQTELLATELQHQLHIPCRNNILYCEKPHRSQTKINKKQRKENVKSVFAVKKPLGGKNIILIDDVVTTCATIAECSKVLKEHSSGTVAVITLARTP